MFERRSWTSDTKVGIILCVRCALRNSRLFAFRPTCSFVRFSRTRGLVLPPAFGGSRCGQPHCARNLRSAVGTPLRFVDFVSLPPALSGDLVAGQFPVANYVFASHSNFWWRLPRHTLNLREMHSFHSFHYEQFQEYTYFHFVASSSQLHINHRKWTNLN